MQIFIEVVEPDRTRLECQFTDDGLDMSLFTDERVRERSNCRRMAAAWLVAVMTLKTPRCLKATQEVLAAQRGATFSG